MPLVPKITALFVALHVVLLLVLAVRVVVSRRRHRIGLGDGAQEHMQQRVRAHGNAAEYIPIAMVELLALELLGLPALWLYVAGGALLLGRILHPLGLSRSSGVSFGRMYGMLLTWLSMLGMAVALLVYALR